MVDFFKNNKLITNELKHMNVMIQQIKQLSPITVIAVSCVLGQCIIRTTPVLFELVWAWWRYAL